MNKKQRYKVKLESKKYERFEEKKMKMYPMGYVLVIQDRVSFFFKISKNGGS